MAAPGLSEAARCGDGDLTPISAFRTGSEG